ncbi:MAG: IPT/TIG domain-containing protein, partial [Candidatus Nomurabacteria bacterium]|nr:IPT/TIG domain-containing protein [Candidatus Nomurabacteria bacterium]
MKTALSAVKALLSGLMRRVRRFISVHSQFFRIKKPKPTSKQTVVKVAVALFAFVALAICGASFILNISKAIDPVTITSVDPARGLIAGGQEVLITGSGFSAEWKQIAAGDSHTCAIASDNQAYCWGRNNYGQLGDNTTTDSLVPVA